MNDIIEHICCPESDCDGVLVERKNNTTGKVFYSCSNYFITKCNYTKTIKSMQNLENKIKYIIDFVKFCTNMNVDAFLKSKKWTEDIDMCLRIFYFQSTLEDKEYLEQKIKNKHLIDRRTLVEFAFTLICGWIVEDALAYYLTSLGWEVYLSSKDSKRQFLKQPKSDSDFCIIVNNKKFFIEQISDFTNQWYSKGYIALRDNKYPNLKKEKAYLLGIDFVHHSFIFESVLNQEVTKESLYGPYEKPAYLMNISEDDFHDLSLLNDILFKTVKS